LRSEKSFARLPNRPLVSRTVLGVTFPPYILGDKIIMPKVAVGL